MTPIHQLHACFAVGIFLLILACVAGGGAGVP